MSPITLGKTPMHFPRHLKRFAFQAIPASHGESVALKCAGTILSDDPDTRHPGNSLLRRVLAVSLILGASWLSFGHASAQESPGEQPGDQKTAATDSAEESQTPETGFAESESSGDEKLQPKTTPADSQADYPDNKTPEFWVEQLGHDRFLRRETATRQLIRSGKVAVDPLLKAIETGNLETNQRAVVVLSAIAEKQHHADEAGALGALRALARKSIGTRLSMVERALSEIAQSRIKTALQELRGEGYEIGPYHFTFNMASTIARITMLRIGDGWDEDEDKLAWSRWVYNIGVVELRGSAVCKQVLQEVAKMPNLYALTLVDGQLNPGDLAALQDVQKLNQLELRYVPVDEETRDALAKIPIRLELSLMGTGITDAEAEQMQIRDPSILLHHHNGAFLGVKCDPGGLTCRINEIVPNSAAMEAGLRQGDTIIGLDEIEVGTFNDLREVIKSHVAEDKIRVKYVRGGTEVETDAVLKKYRAP